MSHGRATGALESRVRSRLADLSKQDLTRVLRPPFGIDLSSNDYLKLAEDPRLRAAFARGIASEGVGSTGSRLLRGDRLAFARAEARFAAWKGTERALFLSSGYLANIAVLTALTESGDVIFSDALNHASLIDAMRLSKATRVVFPHSDVAALDRLIDITPCSGHRFVVVESLFSMDGDEAPLADYAALCRRADASLVVDEAHALGVYGANGTGRLEACGVANDTLVSINPAGKALGVGGALVAAPAWVIEYLVQRARPFVFSTASPPAMAYALEESLRVVQEEPERREHVRALATHLRVELVAAGFDAALTNSQIVPIRMGSNDAALAVAASLQQDGFDVRAIRPPTVPPGTARLRVSINAGLDQPTIDRFVAGLVTAVEGVRDRCKVSS